MGSVRIKVGLAPEHDVTYARVCDHIDPVRKEFLAVERKVDTYVPEIFFCG
jgi:hypothetical protein